MIDLIVFKRCFVLIYALLLIALLIFGMLIADEKTRGIAYKEAKPVFNIKAEDGILNINFFDKSYDINIEGELISTIAEAYKKSAPLGKKSVRALKNIIEKTVDRFLQVFGQ